MLDAVEDHIRPGVTTDHLDAVVHDLYIAAGGYPSTLGYRGFAKSLCTSVNEVVAHGIPDDRPLADGEIVNCDVTIYLDGVHGDCSRTYLVGDVDDGTRHLVDVTREALEPAIEAVRPGARVRDIGRAIQKVAEANGYGVVRELGGHDIGTAFHGPLFIPHYDDPRASLRFVAGDDVHDRADADDGRPGRRHVGRRLDDRHPGRAAVGAVRAHGARHRLRGGSAHAVIIDCAAYTEGRRRPEELELTLALEAAHEPDTFVWIGLYKPTEQEFEAVAKEFELHPLAVEDAIHAHQRPKVEVYESSLFIVLKCVRYIDETSSLEFAEIHLFVGANYVVSVRHGEGTALS